MLKQLALFTFFFILHISTFAQKAISENLAQEIQQFKALEAEGDYQTALEYATKAYQLAISEIGENDSISLNNKLYIGIYQYELGDFEGALKTFEENKRKWKELKGVSHPEYADNLMRIGSIQNDLGDYKLSEKHYKEALQNLNGSKYKVDFIRASCANNLAFLYHDLGQYGEAERYYLEASNNYIKANSKETEDYSNVLNNLSLLYQDMGLFEKAENFLIQSNTILLKITGTKDYDYAGNLNNLAALYQDMRRYEDAEKNYLEAKDILEKTIGIEHQYYAFNLNNLASLYKDQNRLEESLELMNQASRLIANIYGEESHQYAIQLDNLAAIKADINNEANVLDNYLKANAIYAKLYGQKHPSYARSLNNLADYYLIRGQADSCKYYLLKSLEANSEALKNPEWEIFEELDSPISDLEFLSERQVFYTFDVLLNLAKQLYEKEKTPKQLNNYDQYIQLSLKLAEKLRQDRSSDLDKLRILKYNHGFAQQGIRLAHRVSSSNQINKAFLYAEQNKSILLADAIKGDQARNFGDLPDSLAKKEQYLIDELSYLKYLRLEVNDKDEKSEILAEIQALQIDFEELKEILEQQYPKYHNLKYQSIQTSIQELQENLGAKKLLLEYFVADSSTFLFAIGQKTVELYDLQLAPSKLNQQIQSFRQNLSEYNYIFKDQDKSFSAYNKIGHWFYQKLIASAIKNKDIDQLIIITDGELGHLPFETFLIEPSDSDHPKDWYYLIKDYKLSYHYSASLWNTNRKSSAKANNGQILAYAATYQSQDSSLLDLRLPNSYNQRNALAPIPAAIEEVKTLSKLYKGSYRIGPDANERSFKAEAKNYAILHLAMHGLLNKKFPMLSSLAFTEDRDSSENNFLQAYEISKMELHADLVVLSACETGYGKFQQGEGIVSLARGFMYAGVEALVVSLWSVNDQSTSAIMALFYKELSSGLDKASALRQAKLDYIKANNGIAAHPAFWSPFILIGDERPIQLRKQNNMGYWPWLIAGLGTLVLGFGLWYWNRKRNT